MQYAPRRLARVSSSGWTAAAIYSSPFGVAVLVTSAATPLIERLATHLGVIDRGEEERRMHAEPKPRIGGVAVFFGFACALFAVLGFALASPFALFPSAMHERSVKQVEVLTISSPPSISSSVCSSAAC